MKNKIILFSVVIAVIGGGYYSTKKNYYVRSKIRKIERQVKDFLHTPAINKYKSDAQNVANTLPDIDRSNKKIMLPEHPDARYLKTLP